MSCPQAAACCMCWDKAESRGPVGRSCWVQGDVGCRPIGDCFLEGIFLRWVDREKKYIFGKKNWKPVYLLFPLLSLNHCIGPCLGSGCFISPRMKPAGINKWCHFRYLSSFQSLFPLLWQTSAWGTDTCNQFYVLSRWALAWISVPKCLTQLLFEMDLELLLKSLQCSLHLWLSSLNKLLSLLTNDKGNFTLRWICMMTVFWLSDLNFLPGSHSWVTCNKTQKSDFFILVLFVLYLHGYLQCKKWFFLLNIPKSSRNKFE